MNGHLAHLINFGKILYLEKFFFLLIHPTHRLSDGLRVDL